jgi:hypothetical protein
MMPLAEKGVRGKAAGLAPPQHTETRSAISAPKQPGRLSNCQRFDGDLDGVLSLTPFRIDLQFA